MSVQLIIGILTAIGAIGGILIGYFSWLNNKHVRLYNEYENYLKLLSEHIDKTSFFFNGTNHVGVDSYSTMYDLLYKHAMEKKIQNREDFIKFYKEFCPRIQASIGDFFRMCHHIAIFVMKHRFLRKARYYDQFRLILPEAARLLLFYNGLVLSSSEFLEALRKMKIFKNLNYEKLINLEHINWYDSDFFGEIWTIANKSLHLIEKRPSGCRTGGA
ncbi:MAG: hypothetical protein ACTSPW_11100 [Promethearchaeota archaeon]